VVNCLDTDLTRQRLAKPAVELYAQGVVEARSTEVSEKQAICIAFDRAAKTYDAHAQFQRDVADWLVSELESDLTGQHFLDLGCGTGYVAQRLIERGAKVTCVDLSQAMLDQASKRLSSPKVRFVQADAESLPFGNACFDGVVSSLALQWCSDLSKPLAEMKRILKPGGRGLFTSLTDGSLQELQQAWSYIDSHQHVNTFCHTNKIKFALQQVSPFDNLLHCRKFVIWYSSALGLMKDLKGIGATHVEGRSAGLTSGKTLREVEHHYQQFAQPDGLPATYQVCLGLIK
jgi:malonyl-CoA O-methyltransferase